MKQNVPELSLRETQRLFLSVITNPLSQDQRLTPELANGESAYELAEVIVKPNDRLSSMERIEIYNRQYWFRLIDCLYDDFPGLRAVLGEKRFYNIVVNYLTKYPSESFTLRNLGSRLQQFLRAEPHLMGARSRAALDMVRFEWAQIIAFDEASWPVLDPQVLTNIDAKKLKLHLQPYISLLELSYPLDDLVIALRRSESDRSEAATNSRSVASTAKRIALGRQKTIFLVVHRLHNSLYYKRLEKSAFMLLQSLKAGQALEAACESALPFFKKSQLKSGESTKLIQQWFTTWMQLQWFGIPPKSD